MLYVYQLHLSDAHVNELNAAGDWGKVSWGKAYMNMTFGDYSQESLQVLIDAGIVKHTKTINTTDLDEAFDIGNYMGDNSKIVWQTKSSSVSVGDIFVDAQTNSGHVVANFGFTTISVETVKWMQTQVATNMGLAEAL